MSQLLSRAICLVCPILRRSIRQALRAPLGAPTLSEQVHASDRVGIIFSDLTRPTPNQIILPALLAELPHVPRENITLFNALGTHRPNTDAELRGMLGDALVDNYRIVQNNAFDQATQHYRGVTSHGHAIWINRQLEACDIKILTGFIEPHLFAGFSGGGKAIMPGMAGQQTVLGNHDARNIAHPSATWGVTWGNPIWEEIREVAVGSGRVFLLNVTLNKAKQLTGVFAGDLDQAHAAGCAFVKQTAMLPVPHPFDIVITTNSGYPLDLNLYQSVKGMSAASQIVRPGRRDPDRCRMLGRHSRARVVRRAAAPGLQPARTSGSHHRPGFPETGPVAGADPGPDPAQS